MQCRAVIPDEKIPKLPFVAVVKLRLEHMIIQLVQQRIALGFLQALDGLDADGVEVDRFLARCRVRAGDGMAKYLAEFLNLVLCPFDEFSR